MDSDQITSLDLPDFWVDYLDSGIRGSSLPWKEPTLAEGSACWGCISLSLAFKWVVGKELCSFPSSHNRGLHPIPGTASFPRGFWAERAQPLNLATLGQCVISFSWLNQAASCQLESSTRAGNTSTDWASLDTKHNTSLLALPRADLEEFYLACRQKWRITPHSYRKEW